MCVLIQSRTEGLSHTREKMVSSVYDLSYLLPSQCSDVCSSLRACSLKQVLELSHELAVTRL